MSYSFENGKYSLFHDSKLVGYDFLLSYDNIYLIDIVALFNESLQLSRWGANRKLINENLG